MRSFILGGLIATCVWVFMTLGGVSKINQAWASYELSGKVAVAEELAKEREKAFSDSYRPDRSCGTNASELKKLECRNRADMARTQFFAHGIERTLIVFRSDTETPVFLTGDKKS